MEEDQAKSGFYPERQKKDALTGYSKDFDEEMGVIGHIEIKRAISSAF